METRIRIIEDSTPDPDLCTCSVGSTVRQPEHHDTQCAYSEACFKAYMIEHLRMALDAGARNIRPPIRQIAFYTRVASASQIDTDGSLAAQERTLLSAVHRHYPYDGKTIISKYQEFASGRGIASRPLLQRLLRSVEKHAVDMVLVTDFSRLSRSLLELPRIRATLQVNGCALVSLQEGYFGGNERWTDEATPSSTT
jgi:hypothetical protein